MSNLVERLESWATDIETHIAQGHERGWALDYIAAREAEATLLREAAAALSRYESGPASELVKQAMFYADTKDKARGGVEGSGTSLLRQLADALSRAEASFARRTDELKRLAKDWADERDRASRAEAQRDALAKAAAPFVAVPMRGQYGGPLVHLAAIYEDETVDRVGGFASVSKTALRALAAAADIQDDKGGTT